MKIRTDFLSTSAASQLAGSGGANSMSNFASLLQQQSRAPALAPMAPTVTAAPPKAASSTSEATGDHGKTESTCNASTDAADEAAPDDAASKPRPPSKPRARQADSQAPARAVRDENPSARNEKQSVAATDEASATTPADAKAQGDAATPNWFAVLMAPPNPSVPTGAASAPRGTGLTEAADGTETLPADADAADGATGAIGATRGRGLPTGARKVDAREALDPADTGRGAVSGSKEQTSSLPGFAAVLAEQRHADAAPHHEAVTPSVDAARGAAASGASANSGVTQDAAGAGNAQVHAAVGSPEFPQELGVQLSVLARDGVQKAELHLNPTEMGPVSVQIVMDGTQARIDFGADVAATRHAIEAGLPELASALRDAGFTLAGGGVSQHAGSRQGSEGDGARRDGGAVRSIASRTDGGDSGDTRSHTVRTRVAAGGVDVYA